MPTESGLKLRTKLESAKTLKFTNASTSATYTAGGMTVIGSTIGVLVEDVGTSGQSKDDDYPNGPDGVLVYEAEKILLPKATGTGESFSPGDVAYYNSTNKELSTSTSGTKCAIALESISTSDTEALVDLMILA